MNDLDKRIREQLRGSAEAFEPAEGVSLPRVLHRARVLRVRALVVVLVVALFIASGAVIATLIPSSTRKGSFIEPSKTASVDPNYSITVAVATQLADNALIPPGSTATGPSVNGRLGPEVPRGNQHFVDVKRFWIVPMPLSETVRWISGHRPRGAGYATGSGGPNSLAWHLTDDTSQAYADRAIQYSTVAAPGGHTLMRVDGTALWLSSMPTGDTLGGRKIRVTIATGCPRSLAKYSDVDNPSSEELKKQLIPSAEPTAGLVCRYETRSPGSTFPLPKFETALGSNGARKLARQLRTLKVGFDGGGITSCSGLNAQVRLIEIVVLSYPGRPDVDLWYGIGCRGFVVNGFVLADDPITP